MEQNDSNSFQDKEKDESFSQESFGKENLHDEHDGDKPPTPQFQKDDGSKEIKDVHDDSQITDNPFTVKVKTVNVERYAEYQDTVLPGGEVEKNAQNETFRSWFKVIIPHGRKYDKIWIINLLQNHCSVPFSPVDFQYIRNKVQFYVQDSRTASALKSMSYQIFDYEYNKIPIFVCASTEPVSVQYKLTAEQMEQLKIIMKKRYNISQHSLDLRKIHFDPGLKNCSVDIFLNRRSCMVATLKIIQENFPKLLSLNLHKNKIYWLDALSDLIEKAPQVKILNLSKNELKSVGELEKIKGLKLQELWLEGNPLCRTFSHQYAYVNAVLKYFPKLSRLDGQEIFPIHTTTGTVDIMRPCTESYKGSEALKSLIVQFTLQYYLIYDYGNRYNLLCAYHDEACFSLTSFINSGSSDLSSLGSYFNNSMNMTRLTDPSLWMPLLKHTKYDIVASLHELPQTQHDFYSFIIDIWFQTEKMICFSINGVFREGGHCEGCIRAFTRTFILASDYGCNLCIVNDKLTVRNAGPREMSSIFSIPMFTTFSSCNDTVSQSKKIMMKDSSTQTEMWYPEEKEGENNGLACSGLYL